MDSALYSIKTFLNFSTRNHIQKRLLISTLLIRLKLLEINKEDYKNYSTCLT